MNSLTSNDKIRWGISIVAMLLVIGFTGIASAQPPLTTDGQLELKSLDITKSRDDVPGDHDDITGSKYPNIRDESGLTAACQIYPDLGQRKGWMNLLRGQIGVYLSTHIFFLF